MASERHSYVRFFPSDWTAGTARMPRLHKSVYLDICVYNWDMNAPVPPGELALMVADIAEGPAIIEALVAAGKVVRCEDGCLANPRAMAEAKHSFEVWKKKSEGGSRGAGKRWKDNTPNGNANRSAIGNGNGKTPKTDRIPNAEPEPELEQGSVSKDTAQSASKDPIKELFDFGLSVLCEAGVPEKQARSQIGKWRKARGEAEVMVALMEARTKAVSEPIEWLEKRLSIPAYRSASGWEYKGSREAIMREAEKRADWGTYWKVKGDIQKMEQRHG